MAELKQRLQQDLQAAMKAREPRRVATLRMALAAIGSEEVSGSAARELTDEDVVGVLTKEAKKRRESADAYLAAGRDELAATEQAEGEILADYLPAQLHDAEIEALAQQAVTEIADQEGQRPGPKQMGHVMKLAQAKAAGRAEGSRVAAAVRAALADS